MVREAAQLVKRKGRRIQLAVAVLPSRPRSLSAVRSQRQEVWSVSDNDASESSAPSATQPPLPPPPRSGPTRTSSGTSRGARNLRSLRSQRPRRSGSRGCRHASRACRSPIDLVSTVSKLRTRVRFPSPAPLRRLARRPRVLNLSIIGAPSRALIRGPASASTAARQRGQSVRFTMARAINPPGDRRLNWWRHRTRSR